MGYYNQYKARDCSCTECKSKHMLHTLALWGLVTYYGEGGGGATKQQVGGGQVKFYPYKKGGRKKFHPCWRRGGHIKFWGRVYQFDSALSKIGISPELSIHFMDGIHQIEGNYSLNNMRKKNCFIKIWILENITITIHFWTWIFPLSLQWLCQKIFWCEKNAHFFAI